MILRAERRQYYIARICQKIHGAGMGACFRHVSVPALFFAGNRKENRQEIKS